MRKIGYDVARPGIEIYQDFLEKSVRGLEPLGAQGLSFMTYGSSSRGIAKQFDVGRSDIDSVMFFSF